MIYLHQHLTDRIIHSFFSVYNTMGYGLLEKVHEHAMMIELGGNGLAVENQKSVEVQYKNQLVGDYDADIIVEHAVILELKAAESVVEEHKFQLINY